MQEITPKTAHEMLGQGRGAQLLDVREPWEVKVATIEGALHIPMQEVPGHLTALDPGRDVIVVCHHGHRSRMVAHFLEQNGYERVFNLQGGVAAWAREIDAGMTSY